MEKVLVAGATGTTGKQVVEILNKHKDYTPIAMVRKQEQKSQFDNAKIETRMADLTNDLSGITQGIDRVIFAAGSGGENVEEVDRDGAIDLIKDAVKHEVKKFVMLSSVGADKPEEAGEDMQPYLEAKHKADEFLRDTNLNYTIVRPGPLNNEDETGSIRLEEKIDNPGEIPRADVAQVLVDSLDDRIAHQKTFEIVSGDRPIRLALAGA